MSRDSYSTSGDPGPAGRGGQRWDTERFAAERDRVRFGGEERFDERDSQTLRPGPFGGHAREHSVDEAFQRRGPRGGYEEERYDRRSLYDEEPRYERPLARERSMAIEKERERQYYDPSPPPPRRAPARPGFLRRQSSLDTFDRKPLTRFVERTQREEYGPPARYREEFRPPPIPPLTPIPLPRTRALGPPRRFADREREYYDEIEIAEPDYYGDDAFRAAPELIREREIVRRRRRSRSKERKSHAGSHVGSHVGSTRGSVRGSVRSSSIGSSSSSETASTISVNVKNEFPKKGKTRMPARLVHKRAIIDLGYPFEEEGETIIILKALGRENIDEVIKLSEDYRISETRPEISTTLTTYLVGPEAQMSGGRSEAGTIVEERHEVFSIPPPPPPPAPAPVQNVETFEEVKITERTSVSPARSHHHHHSGPIILNANPREESTFIERRDVERSDAMQVGALALALPSDRRDERSIRAEIRALEAEKEALRAEKRAERELRKAERIRRGGRSSESDLVLYDRDDYDRVDEDVTIIRRERVEDEGGVRIEKNRKGRMAISVPKYYR